MEASAVIEQDQRRLLARFPRVTTAIVVRCEDYFLRAKLDRRYAHWLVNCTVCSFDSHGLIFLTLSLVVYESLSLSSSEQRCYIATFDCFCLFSKSM